MRTMQAQQQTLVKQSRNILSRVGSTTDSMNELSSRGDRQTICNSQQHPPKEKLELRLCLLHHLILGILSTIYVGSTTIGSDWTGPSPP